MPTEQAQAGGSRVVIVGAGHGGIATAVGLRRGGFAGEILVVGDETHGPYHRPPLSKAFGEASYEQPLLTTEAARDQEIELRSGVRVIRIRRGARVLETADGGEIRYDILVLALGSRPRPLPVRGAELSGVLHLRTLNDAGTLRTAIGAGRRLIVIGGGWIGLEVAAAANHGGTAVTVIEREERLLARAGSVELASALRDLHEAQGIDFQTGAGLCRLLPGPDGAVASVELDDGTRHDCDVVLVGIGSAAHDDLARDAGLDCDDGVLVDGTGRTEDPLIYAVGDVARRRDGVRLESIPAAGEQASRVVSGILGQPPIAADPPWFWSDQGALKVQIAGLLPAARRSAVLGTPASGRFVVAHIDGRGRLRAAESVNAPRAFIAARRLIAAETTVDLGALPEDLLPSSIGEAAATTGGAESPTASVPGPGPAAPDDEGPLTIRFVAGDGSSTEVEVEAGTAVVEGASRLGVPWIVAECGGGCSCGTCCVDIDDSWFERLEEPMPEELDLVEFAEGAGPRTRLACQILMTPELNGLVVREPGSGGAGIETDDHSSRHVAG